MPVPMTQEEVLHVSKFMQQTLQHQQVLQLQVQVPVPMTQEVVLHVPKLMQQTLQHQQVLQLEVQVPVPMTQEEVLLMQQTHLQHQQVLESPVLVLRHEDSRGRLTRHAKNQTFCRLSWISRG